MCTICHQWTIPLYTDTTTGRPRIAQREREIERREKSRRAEGVLYEEM